MKGLIALGGAIVFALVLTLPTASLAGDTQVIRCASCEGTDLGLPGHCEEIEVGQTGPIECTEFYSSGLGRMVCHDDSSRCCTVTSGDENLQANGMASFSCGEMNFAVADLSPAVLADAGWERVASGEMVMRDCRDRIVASHLSTPAARAVQERTAVITI